MFTFASYESIGQLIDQAWNKGLLILYLLNNEANQMAYHQDLITPPQYSFFDLSVISSLLQC